MANTINNLYSGILTAIKKPFNNPFRKLGVDWFDVKKLKHGSGNKLHRQKFLNGWLEFYGPQEFIYGVKEIFIEEIYKQTFKRSPYIIDCGANIGLSVIYLKQIAPDAKIIAFEPDKINFRLLNSNLKTQGITDVDTRMAAVWTENTVLKFSNNGNMSSKIGSNDIGQTTDVEAVRLLDFMDREIDFLKMDIEGAEFKVLNDIHSKFPLIKNMFIEYHGTFANIKELNQIFSWIEQYGFSFYIKEAADIFPHPFEKNIRNTNDFDIQLNIFCSRM